MEALQTKFILTAARTDNSTLGVCTELPLLTLPDHAWEARRVTSDDGGKVQRCIHYLTQMFVIILLIRPNLTPTATLPCSRSRRCISSPASCPPTSARCSISNQQGSPPIRTLSVKSLAATDDLDHHHLQPLVSMRTISLILGALSLAIIMATGVSSQHASPTHI